MRKFDIVDKFTMQDFVNDRKEFLKETTGALAQLSGVLREANETPIEAEAIEKALRGMRFVRLLSNHFRLKEISMHSRRVENTLFCARKNQPLMGADFKTWLVDVIKDLFVWISADRKPQGPFFKMPQLKQKGDVGRFLSFRTPVGKQTLPFVLELPFGNDLECKFLEKAPTQAWDVGKIIFGPKFSSLQNHQMPGLWYLKIPGTQSFVSAAWKPEIIEVEMSDVIHPLKGTRFAQTPLVSGLVRKEGGFSALLQFKSNPY